MTHNPTLDLAPPQPRDAPATRPTFNLPSMAVQVWLIQTWLTTERARKQAAKEASDISLKFRSQ